MTGEVEDGDMVGIEVQIEEKWGPCENGETTQKVWGWRLGQSLGRETDGREMDVITGGTTRYQEKWVLFYF